MPEEDEEPAWFRNFKGISCGTTAGIAITLAGHPFDMLKVRLQTQSQINPVYSGIYDCISKTIKWEGFRGFYKGVGSPLSAQILYRAYLFSMYYETLHLMRKIRRNNQELKPIDYYICSFITGAFSPIVICPIELLKSKIQVQILAEKNKEPVAIKYRGVFHCLRHIYSTYGIRGLYQGFTSILLRDSFGLSLYFGCFENLRLLWTPPGKRVENLSLFKFETCAIVAGWIYWACIYNFDVIRAVMMADDSDISKRKYSSITDCVRQLYKNEGGYKRFWKGINATLIRSFVVSGIMLYIVDVTRKLFPSYKSLFK